MPRSTAIRIPTPPANTFAVIDEKMAEYFDDWKQREEAAASMIPLIGAFYRNSGVVTTVDGHSLAHGSAIDILKALRFARQIISDELSVFSSLTVVPALSALERSPARIDSGKLTTRYQRDGDSEIAESVRREIAPAENGHGPLHPTPQYGTTTNSATASRWCGSSSISPGSNSPRYPPSIRAASSSCAPL